MSIWKFYPEDIQLQNVDAFAANIELWLLHEIAIGKTSLSDPSVTLTGILKKSLQDSMENHRQIGFEVEGLQVHLQR